jgi:hypothetical protein
MPARILIAALLCAAAVRAEEVQGLLDRPITLPRKVVEVTFHGTYTNFADGTTTGQPGTITGETIELGADVGATERLQVGVAAAMAIHPGAGFGSILLSGAYAVAPNTALRVDVGFESIGLNGGNVPGFENHTSRYFSGVGARIVVPLAPNVAFVTGRTGAVHFGHFNNVKFGDTGVGLYRGATQLAEGASDFLIVSAGDETSATVIGATVIGINLPAGVLVQPDPHLALTVLAGYSALIGIPRSGPTSVSHFIPIGLEAVFTPAPPIDVGFRFLVNGPVRMSNGPAGYFDERALMLWFRFRA